MVCIIPEMMEEGVLVLLGDYTYLTLFAYVITGENFGRTLRRKITEAPFQTCPKVGNKQVKSTRVDGMYKPQGSENWGTHIILPLTRN